jgi:hypothetical protein
MLIRTGGSQQPEVKGNNDKRDNKLNNAGKIIKRGDTRPTV